MFSAGRLFRGRGVEGLIYFKGTPVDVPPLVQEWISNELGGCAVFAPSYKNPTVLANVS